MSFYSIKQDITKVEKGVIIHGVNCQNVMGSGIAKVLYTKWPAVKREYHEYCRLATKNSVSRPPYLLGAINPVKINSNLYVVNAFTQLEFGTDGGRFADLDSIKLCFSRTLRWMQSLDEDLWLFTPSIGCGLAGLNWSTEVMPAIKVESKWHEDKTIVHCEL